MKALITKPPPGKITLHKLDKRVKFKEPKKYKHLVEVIKKENHIKTINDRCVWYLIHLAKESIKTHNPAIEIFCSDESLRKNVNYSKARKAKNVTRKILYKLLINLQDNGLIDYQPGGFKPKHKNGICYKKFYTGRVIFKPDFMAQIHLIDDKTNKFDITYKSVNSLSWITTTETRRDKERIIVENETLEKELFDYNSFMLSQDIKEDGRQKTITYTRIFCLPDLTLHGRYYSLFSWSSKENRHLFTINGNPLVELDFSSMFVAMLRDNNNLDKMDNLYQIDGFDRTLVKIAVNIMLNARSQNSAIRAISKENKISIDKSKNLVNLITVKHHELKDYFFKDSGMKLMWLESEITRLAQRDCVKKNIPVICLHDGYYTTSKHVDDLKAILELSYKNVIGADLNMAISIKEISAPHNAPQAKVIKKSYNDKPKIETYHVNA